MFLTQVFDTGTLNGLCLFMHGLLPKLAITGITVCQSDRFTVGTQGLSEVSGAVTIMHLRFIDKLLDSFHSLLQTDRAYSSTSSVSAVPCHGLQCGDTCPVLPLDLRFWIYPMYDISLRVFLGCL